MEVRKPVVGVSWILMQPRCLIKIKFIKLLNELAAYFWLQIQTQLFPEAMNVVYVTTLPAGTAINQELHSLVQAP